MPSLMKRRILTCDTPSLAAALRSFFALMVERDGAHVDKFHYVSPNTDLMGWVVERATGERYADLVSDYLWRPMGAERSAYITVDRLGAPRCAGGFCATTRDLARLGLLISEGGKYGGSRSSFRVARRHNGRRGCGGLERRRFPQIFSWQHANPLSQQMVCAARRCANDLRRRRFRAEPLRGPDKPDRNSQVLVAGAAEGRRTNSAHHARHRGDPPPFTDIFSELRSPNRIATDPVTPRTKEGCRRPS
ncbi:MAG: serine hydrolase [Rhizobiaceae bacterium]